MLLRNYKIVMEGKDMKYLLYLYAFIKSLWHGLAK